MATQLGGLLNSRQQLMRDMSHELRSPLARLQAALALADRKRPLPGAELARINLEIERMNQAIGDVLRFTRLEAAPLQAKHLLRIEDLLETLVADERDEAAAREIQLELLTVPALDVVGDPSLLRSGFENVLRNAIRHAPTGSKVLIDARTTDSTITVLIEDRGPGVPENMLERIFDPYVRLGGDTDDRTGTGLGLAIARRVFEAHDGRITAERAAPSGLRVRIELARAC
jgi:signal transduction histidine kinase